MGLIVAWLLMLSAIALALVPSGVANGTPTDLSHGYLYFKGEEVGTREGPQAEFCGPLPVYRVSSEPPTEPFPTKIPGRDDNCLVFFSYEVEEAFTLRQGTVFTYWLGCESLYFGAQSPVNRVHIRFERNGEWVGLAHSDVPPYYLCGDGSYDPIRIDAVYGGDEEPYEVGDELSMIIWHHHLNVDPMGMIQYIALDSTQYPSAVHGVGIPGKLRADLYGDLLARTHETRAEAGPGKAASYPVTVYNQADSEVQMNVIVTGNDAWYAAADQAVVTVPAGGSTDLTIWVQAPTDAGEGDHAHHVVSLVPTPGDMIRFQTTTIVKEGTGSPLEIGQEAETPGPGIIPVLTIFGVLALTRVLWTQRSR